MSVCTYLYWLPTTVHPRTDEGKRTRLGKDLHTWDTYGRRGTGQQWRPEAGFGWTVTRRNQTNPDCGTEGTWTWWKADMVVGVPHWEWHLGRPGTGRERGLEVIGRRTKDPEEIGEKVLHTGRHKRLKFLYTWLPGSPVPSPTRLLLITTVIIHRICKFLLCWIFLFLRGCNFFSNFDSRTWKDFGSLTKTSGDRKFSRPNKSSVKWIIKESRMRPLKFGMMERYTGMNFYSEDTVRDTPHDP